jgi:hypothetical protein
MRSSPGLRTRPVRSTLPTAILGPAAILGLVLGGSPLTAQTAAPLTPQPAPADRQAMMTEYRAASQRFTALNQQAFATNPDLRTQETALNEMILRTMNEVLPAADAEMARFDSLQAQAMAAQQAQDGPRLNAIIAELGALQGRLQNARTEVMARPEVQARVVALESALMQTMLQLDPGAQSLLDRLDELSAMLSGAPALGG